MYNKIILAGNLTRDIELRYTQGGMAIASTAIATNRKFKKQSGEQVDETMFIDIAFFGKTAEIANQYLRKGSKVLVEGRLKLDQWTDQQSGQKRSKHVVSVESMQMLGSRGDGQQQANTHQQQTYGQPQPATAQSKQQAYGQPYQNGVPVESVDIEDDEIPF